MIGPIRCISTSFVRISPTLVFGSDRHAEGKRYNISFATFNRYRIFEPVVLTGPLPGAWADLEHTIGPRSGGKSDQSAGDSWGTSITPYVDVPEA